MSVDPRSTFTFPSTVSGGLVVKVPEDPLHPRSFEGVSESSCLTSPDRPSGYETLVYSTDKGRGVFFQSFREVRTCRDPRG